MKLTTLFLAFLISGSAIAEHTQTITDSTINKVTVYQDRARVIRSATVELKAGKNVIAFEKLPMKLEGKSLRSRLSNTTIKLLGISWERVVTNTIENNVLSTLEKKKEELQDEDRVLKDNEKALRTEKEQIKSYYKYAKGVMSEQATKEVVKGAPSWNDSISFLDKRTAACDTELDILTKKRKKLADEIKAVKKELSKYLSPQSRTSYTAYVTVQTKQAVKSTIELSYVTYGAKWTPRYDARISTTDKKLALHYRADVHQRTGEDWDNVNLVLSTAQPQISATPPKLQTLWVSSEKRQSKNKPTIVMEQEQMVGAVEAAPSLMEDVGAVSLDADAIPDEKVEENGLSVAFNIPAKATIPADNRPYQVEVTTLDYPSNISFESIPKLRPYVYLKSKVKNASSYPLLAGPVTIFRNGSYIGSSKIEFAAANAALELFAGIDENIQVRRQEIKQKQYNRKLFRSNAEKKYAWETLIVNNSSKQETISLIDSIPVSEIEEVQIKLDGETTKGYSFDRKTGKLIWKLALPSRGTKKIILAYTVKK